MDQFTTREQLGNIVAAFPQSQKILSKYKLDFCCGGKDILGEALKEKGLNEDKVVNELNEAYKEFLNSGTGYTDYREFSKTDLIEHIVATHHVYTRKALKDIDVYLNKILKVHFKHHQDELLKLHRLFGSLKTELEEHLVKEEEVLFPLIERYEVRHDEKTLQDIRNFIAETEAEHEKAGEILKSMDELTNDFTAPEDGCNTYRLVYSLFNELEKDLYNHIHLENTIVFNNL